MGGSREWEKRATKRKCLAVLLSAASVLWATGWVIAAPKGKIVLGMAGEPSTLDPHVLTSAPQGTTFPLVFDTLLFRDHTGRIVPRLATSYRLVSPTVWEFKLREGVRFANGEPMDAHAVKYSIERIVDPKLKSRQIGYFRSVGHVEVMDRYTARIHTKYPDMYLISPLVLYAQIVPPKYYQSRDLKYLAIHPVGSGPYRLVKWKKGEELVFEANPGHWDPSRPRIKSGVIKIIPEPTTRVAALVAGDVDIVEDVPPQLTAMVKSKSNLHVVAGRSPKTCYVVMVIKPGAPWADVRVRKALNYARDVDSITQYVLRGYAHKVATIVGPDSYGYNPDLKPYPYDAERAKQLLAEAGYAQGFSVDMYVPLGRHLMAKEAAEALSGQLAKVGVQARVRAVDWTRSVKLRETRWEPHVQPFWSYGCRLDMTLHAEGMYAGLIHSDSTWGGFRDPEVDKLIDAARAETVEAKREMKYREIDRLLHSEKVPLVFLYSEDQLVAKKASVDWQMRPDTLILISEAGWKE